jgi:hypothetical protein
MSPPDHPAIGRRELLQAGSLSLLGATLPDLLKLDAEGRPYRLTQGTPIRPLVE